MYIMRVYKFVHKYCTNAVYRCHFDVYTHYVTIIVTSTASSISSGRIPIPIKY